MARAGRNGHDLCLHPNDLAIYEKNDRLGGNLIPGGTPDFKEDDHALVRWYEQELDSLQVPVYLKKELSAEEICLQDFDAVIVATGSTPKLFDLGEGVPLCPASDLITGKVKPGKDVVIVGGGLVGCETAIWMAEQGISVTIVEKLEKLLSQNGPLCHANSEMLERLVPFRGVQVQTSSEIISVQEGAVQIRKKDGQEVSIKADMVVLAVGYNNNRQLYDAIQGKIPETYLIGDARKVANIMYAIWDAFEVASSI